MLVYFSVQLLSEEFALLSPGELEARGLSSGPLMERRATNQEEGGEAQQKLAGELCHRILSFHRCCLLEEGFFFFLSLFKIFFFLLGSHTDLALVLICTGSL